MKTLIAALALALLASISSAQESYAVPATAGQVTDLAESINAYNVKTCKRLAQALVCTQANACTAANAAGGASCTAAQARAVNARIYIATTQAGREEFVIYRFAAPGFTDAKGIVPWANQYRACTKWNADNQTAKDASCTAAGLSAGCTLYPATCN